MALDIVSVNEGQDLGVADAVSPKAANLVSTQVADLEYAPTFGVDLKFFLQPDFQFQNESFKAYLVDRLTQNQINVSEVLEVIESLQRKYTFKVGDANKVEGLIA